MPAALYKAMGGFATNGVNMTKLESYMLDGSFTATQFYADIEGHPDDRSVQLAFEELQFFTDHFHVLGVYPAGQAAASPRSAPRPPTRRPPSSITPPKTKRPVAPLRHRQRA